MTRLQVKGVTIRFGGLTALEDVSLSVEEGKVLALIGPNGAGKTTLFNVISGVYRATTSHIELDGADVTTKQPFELSRLGLTRTFQNLQIFFRMTAIENVMVGRNQHERGTLAEELLGLPRPRSESRKSREVAQELIEFVGLKGIGDRVAGELSYGILKRLEIARALATKPSILLLDEPAAGCNATETAEIDQVIKKVASTGVSVVLVEHDIHLVMSVANHIHVLDRGRTLAQGSPREVRENPAVIEAYLGKPVELQAVQNAVG